jgi:hypothetical protein
MPIDPMVFKVDEDNWARKPRIPNLSGFLVQGRWGSRIVAGLVMSRNIGASDRIGVRSTNAKLPTVNRISVEDEKKPADAFFVN